MRGMMEVEYRAAVRMVAAPDFIEGVRCSAVDPVPLAHLHFISLAGSQEHQCGPVLPKALAVTMVGVSHRVQVVTLLQDPAVAHVVTKRTEHSLQSCGVTVKGLSHAGRPWLTRTRRRAGRLRRWAMCVMRMWMPCLHPCRTGRRCAATTTCDTGCMDAVQPANQLHPGLSTSSARVLV